MRRFLCIPLLAALAAFMWFVPSPIQAQIPGSNFAIGSPIGNGPVAGDCLYVNGTVVGQQVCTGVASSLIIGTTGITGGATTQVLFNLGGKVTSDSGLTYAGGNGAVTAKGLIGSSSAGSAAAPSLFIGNVTTGFYSVSTTGLGLSVNGVDVFDYGISNTGVLTIIGASSNPTLSGVATFNGGPNLRVSGSGGYGYISAYGLFYSGGTVGIGNMPISSSPGMDLDSASAVQWNSTTGLVSGGFDSGLSRNAAGVVQVDTTTIGDGLGTIKAAHATITALANTATTSAVCYNTGSGVLTYNGTIGTCATSSMRFKHDIYPVEASTALQDVLRMRPVSFLYNEDQHSPDPQLGLIAEDLAVIDPRLVSYDDEGRPYSIRFLGPMAAKLVGAIQQLQNEISELKQQRKK